MEFFCLLQTEKSDTNIAKIVSKKLLNFTSKLPKLTSDNAIF